MAVAVPRSRWSAPPSDSENSFSRIFCQSFGALWVFIDENEGLAAAHSLVIVSFSNSLAYAW